MYEDLDMRVRVSILDGVKDSLIPHLSGKNIEVDDSLEFVPK